MPLAIQTGGPAWGMHFSQATGQRSHNKNIIPYLQAFEQGARAGSCMGEAWPFCEERFIVKGFAGPDGAGGGNKDKPYRCKFCKPCGARGGTRPARCGDRNVAGQKVGLRSMRAGARGGLQYYMANLHMGFPRDLTCDNSGAGRRGNDKVRLRQKPVVKYGNRTNPEGKPHITASNRSPIPGSTTENKQA